MLSLFQPKNLNLLLEKTTLPLACISSILFAVGLYLTFYYVPDDYQQGITVKIMYIHVPAAWSALFIYGIMSALSLIYLVWRLPLSIILAKAATATGASFAFITLVTGSIWGKPMWGTWWVWDARLTSMLILFIAYMGLYLLAKSFEDKKQGDMPFALVCLLGAINLPIVKFSVDVWNSLHQPASIIRLQGPAIHSSMLWPLLIMIVAFFFYFLTILNLKLRTFFIEKKINRLESKLINKS